MVESRFRKTFALTVNRKVSFGRPKEVGEGRWGSILYLIQALQMELGSSSGQ